MRKRYALHPMKDKPAAGSPESYTHEQIINIIDQNISTGINNCRQAMLYIILVLRGIFFSIGKEG